MSSLNLQAKQCMQTTWHTHFVELTTVPKNFYFSTYERYKKSRENPAC